MDIDYTVAALMFPAIPLMMTMYSNRFHTLSALIRKIHDQYTFEKKEIPLTIVGVGDYLSTSCQPVEAFTNLDPMTNHPTILLCHNPDAKQILAPYH